MSNLLNNTRAVFNAYWASFESENGFESFESLAAGVGLTGSEKTTAAALVDNIISVIDYTENVAESVDEWSYCENLVLRGVTGAPLRVALEIIVCDFLAN